MDYWLKGGRVIDPAQKIDECRDVFVCNGKVFLSGISKSNLQNCSVIDCSGKTVMPGLIDVHTHMRDPGYEYKEDIVTGTRAALAGGVTTLFCMANTHPVTDAESIVSYIVAKSKKSGYVNVHPIAAMTEGMKGKKIVDFASLLNAGAVTFSDDGRWVHDSHIMLTIFQQAAKHSVRVIQHSEDMAMTMGGVMHDGETAQRLGLPGIPSASEYAAIYRDCILCELAKSKLHVAHVSTAESLRIITEAKQRGVNVTCEVAPHHLVMDDSYIKSDNGIYKVNPPLRSPNDRAALIEGLKTGKIDIIATDHAPHAIHEKEKGMLDAPFGMIGMETSFPIMYTYFVLENAINLSKLIELMSANPARLFNLAGKGTLQDGFDADIAVVDLDAEYRINKDALFSKSSNTPFHDWKVRGKIQHVFVGGILKLQNGQIIENTTGGA
ncbi:MAG: dihydroorotase [bacterium]|nr:dihydroorotase [bacterium]